MTTETIKPNDNPISRESVPGGYSVDRFVGHFDPDDQSAFEKLADVYPREISERYPARLLRLWLNWGAVVGAIVLVLVVSLLFFVLDLWTDGGSR